MQIVVSEGLFMQIVGFGCVQSDSGVGLCSCRLWGPGDVFIPTSRLGVHFQVLGFVGVKDWYLSVTLCVDPKNLGP